MLSLQTSGRLMELSKKEQGKLIVHYSERLVTLLREVRQLSALGYVIPAKIQHAAETARKFYRHGVILKQVSAITIFLRHAIYIRLIYQDRKHQIYTYSVHCILAYLSNCCKLLTLII